MRILSEQDHYFRLAAYRVLFPKRVGGAHDGEYAGLDFGHLVDLAGIDQELRGFLLPLTLDVESAAKTKLVGKITEDRGEDGYSIFAEYLAHLNHADRNRRKGEISRLENDAYLGPLVARYPIDEMPAWVFLELSSFGAFTNFYLFCAERWDNAEMKTFIISSDVPIHLETLLHTRVQSSTGWASPRMHQQGTQRLSRELLATRAYRNA